MYVCIGGRSPYLVGADSNFNMGVGEEPQVVDPRLPVYFARLLLSARQTLDSSHPSDSPIQYIHPFNTFTQSTL